VIVIEDESILLASRPNRLTMVQEVHVPTIHVRNVPEEVAVGVKSLARAHRRSMEAEVLELLAQAVSGEHHPPARHINFDLVKAVELGPIDFEPMALSIHEPDL
jgi:plasmid stability protein